jgi:hypothetical protein
VVFGSLLWSGTGVLMSPHSDIATFCDGVICERLVLVGHSSMDLVVISEGKHNLNREETIRVLEKVALES